MYSEGAASEWSGSREVSGDGEELGRLASVIHPSVVPDLKLAQLKQLLREYGCVLPVDVRACVPAGMCDTCDVALQQGLQLGLPGGAGSLCALLWRLHTQECAHTHTHERTRARHTHAHSHTHTCGLHWRAFAGCAV